LVRVFGNQPWPSLDNRLMISYKYIGGDRGEDAAKGEKMRRCVSYWLILGLALALAGCGPAISTNLQRETILGVSFAQLSAHPDQYKGKLVILGGLVMSVKPWENGSLLTVDQRRLDSRFYPVGTTSGGSFAVESKEWLNSNRYLPRAKVVVAGVVEGQQDYMPLLKAKEVTLLAPPTWEKWSHPVPPSWYDYNPQLEYWFTPPYFSPWMRPSGR
jgi:outer membrane lipoprotein